MPWFYAGPEAKPVGPVSLDELHARLLNGSLTPDSYVIEQTPGIAPVWKRYGELFPLSPGIPPLPVAAFQHPPAPPVAPVPVPHPLFPSAPFAPVQSPTYSPVQLRTPPGPMPLHHDHLSPTAKANSWCSWGFGLGVGSFVGLLFCGLGMLVSPFGFVVSIIGLVKVQQHPGETGRGMAITGIILSAITLLITFGVLLSMAVPAIQAHERTVTEQTSNDSE